MTNNKDTSDQKTLILVVGMHRSGTSLATNILSEMSIGSTGKLIEADVNNPEGYFERSDITEIQEQLLIKLNRWWPSEEGTKALPDKWLEQNCTMDASEKIKELLTNEEDKIIAIKDPRTSRLLPLWKGIAEEIQREIRIVLAIRHPNEVIASLVKRDHEATGMDETRAARLWWIHNRETILNSKGLPRMIIDYATWFSDQADKQLEDLAQFCGKSIRSQNELNKLRQIIKPEHRRSRKEASSYQETCIRFYEDMKKEIMIVPLSEKPDSKGLVNKEGHPC